MKNLWTLLGLLFAAIIGYVLRGRNAINEGFKKTEELKAKSAEKEKEIFAAQKEIENSKPPEKKELTPEEIEKFWEKK